MQHDAWLAMVEKFEKKFGHAVGRAETVTAVAERMGLKDLKGLAACRTAYT